MLLILLPDFPLAEQQKILIVYMSPWGSFQGQDGQGRSSEAVFSTVISSRASGKGGPLRKKVVAAKKGTGG